MAAAPTATEPTAAQRRMFAKMGIAMPDGSYYIRNAADLKNAIDSVGQGEQGGKSGATIRKFIIKRAVTLKLMSLIPDSWNPDGTLKDADSIQHDDGEPTAAQRKAWAANGIAMPDGSYYIRNADDLSNAIRAVGRTTTNSGEAAANAVRVHIMKRAADLKLSSQIPDTWNADGSLKHDDISERVDEFFEHFGVKGMHWGVRKSRDSSGLSSHHPASEDAKTAAGHRVTVKKHGTQALSNSELKALVTRLNLEDQHARLNPAHVSAGKRVVNGALKGTGEIAGNAGKQLATEYTKTYAKQGIEHLIKVKKAS